jgi:hypothetical protein
MNIALSVTTYLPAFPPSPKASFTLLRKLDHAFASLLKGEDSITGEILPGFSGGKKAGMSKTDMVRCKSLVEATRVSIVDIMSQDPEPDQGIEESDMETEGEDSSAWDSMEDDKYQMDVARVYEQTITQLGELLGNDEGFEARLEMVSAGLQCGI